MSEELKPCPFCDAPAQIDHTTKGDWICCTKCHGAYMYVMPRNIILWNTRPIEDALRAELAQVRADLEYAHQNIKKFRALNEEILPKLRDIEKISVSRMAELAQVKDDLAYCQKNPERDGLNMLAQYERAQQAESANATLRADAIGMRMEMDVMKTDLAAARQRIEELEQAERWIPVGERMPEKNTADLGGEYLVILDAPYTRVCPMNYEAKDSEGFGAGWFTGGWSTSKTYWNDKVTHWRPLPQLPEVEK